MARRLKIKGLKPPRRALAPTPAARRPSLRSGLEVVDHVLESILPRYHQAQELFRQCVVRVWCCGLPSSSKQGFGWQSRTGGGVRPITLSRHHPRLLSFVSTGMTNEAKAPFTSPSFVLCLHEWGSR